MKTWLIEWLLKKLWELWSPKEKQRSVVFSELTIYEKKVAYNVNDSCAISIACSANCAGFSFWGNEGFYRLGIKLGQLVYLAIIVLVS